MAVLPYQPGMPVSRVTAYRFCGGDPYRSCSSTMIGCAPSNDACRPLDPLSRSALLGELADVVAPYRPISSGPARCIASSRNCSGAGGIRPRRTPSRAHDGGSARRCGDVRFTPAAAEKRKFVYFGLVPIPDLSKCSELSKLTR